MPQAKPVKQAAPTPIKTKSIDVGSITSKVTVGAGGTAMSSTEQDLSRRYVNFIIQRIIQSMQQAGITDLRSAGVEFQVSADGLISGAQITKTSGSASFDRAVLSAFRAIGRIGPPPTKRAEVFRTVINLTEQ